MAKGIPISVGDRLFANKGEAIAFFRSMLNRYQPEDRVGDTDATDLSALLLLHSDAEQKIGAGVDYFEVMAAQFGTKCFQIIRSDGSFDDFSYLHCITPRK